MPRKRILGQKAPYQLEPGPMAAPLHSILERRQLVPRAVSVAAGLPSDTIRNILTGRAKRPSGEVVQALADYLGVSVAVLLGREPLPEQDAPPRTEGMCSISEVEFSTRGLPPPHGAKDLWRRESCVWSVPLALLVRRRLDPGRCLIVEAPEDAEGGIRKHDKLVVDTNDTSPTPPGPFLLWDGWGVGLANLSLLRTGSGERVRVTRPNVPDLLTEAGSYEPLGRVVACWAWT